MNLRSLISPRKTRKTRKKQDVVLAYQCRSGFVAPTETFQGLNRLRNVSDGVANPVTLRNVAPSPAGEGWGEENKNNYLYLPHPNLLPQGRRSGYFRVDAYAFWGSDLQIGLPQNIFVSFVDKKL